MERLSDRAIDIINELHIERLHYFDEYVPLMDAMERLTEYEDADEQELLIALPCKIGDTVYQPGYKFTKCTPYDYAPKYLHDSECEGCEAACDSVRNPHIYVGEVTEIRIRKNDITVGIKFADKFDTSYYTIGKSVFLTREEAMKKE